MATIRFIIKKEELLKALGKLEEAERNGFMYCIPEFKLVSAGETLDENAAEYNEMVEKAHPTDNNLNWGIGQCVTERYTFSDGKLIKIKD